LPTLLGIHGSVTRPGRLYQALELALRSVEDEGGSLSTSLLHLGGHRISFADGRPSPDFSDETEAVVERVMAADMYIIATPIFRASFTGALKNLLDLVPVEGLMGKACGLLAMGHPFGASGIRMIHETVTQLRDEAGPRQVANARVGVAQCSGAGDVTTVHILRRG